MDQVCAQRFKTAQCKSLSVKLQLILTQEAEQLLSMGTVPGSMAGLYIFFSPFFYLLLDHGRNN